MEEKVCSICLAELEEGDQAKCLPCGHILHFQCLRSWLIEQQRCPVCQKSVFVEELTPQERQVWLNRLANGPQAQPVAQQHPHNRHAAAALHPPHLRTPSPSASSSSLASEMASPETSLTALKVQLSSVESHIEALQAQLVYLKYAVKTLEAQQKAAASEEESDSRLGDDPKGKGEELPHPGIREESAESAKEPSEDEEEEKEESEDAVTAEKKKQEELEAEQVRQRRLLYFSK